MTDRELLELAAKAVGACWAANLQTWVCWNGSDDEDEPGAWMEWLPLDDDGDALRLAVKTGEPFVVRTRCVTTMGGLKEDFDPSKQGDDLRATRRIIVRAAAEIQRAKEAT